MMLYNTTFQVDADIETQWANWVEQVYIPQVLAQGVFTKATLLRVLSETGEPTGSFALQFSGATQQQLADYLTHQSTTHHQEIAQQFGTKVLAFSTPLEIISHQP
ncbi:MAG: DUF4286 family protein [Flavobacteriaceae bacterium]